AGTVERYMHKVEPERQPELLADEVCGRSGPRGSEVVFAGAGFDEADKVSDRLDRQRRMNRKHQGCADRDGHRVEVFIRIIGDFVVQGWVDDDIGRNNEYGVAVRCCPCRLTHTDVAASTADVLDVELFPEMLGQALRDQAAEYIRRTTGRVWNDHTHGACRIGLRPGDPRDDRQRGSARCQMQELSAGKFHEISLRLHDWRTLVSRSSTRAPLPPASRKQHRLRGDAGISRALCQDWLRNLNQLASAG